MSLRIMLIIIGVVIVGAVYAITAAKRRRDSRASFDRRFSRLDVPDVILQHDEDDYEVEHQAAAIPAEPLLAGRGVILPPEDVSLDELPRVVNDFKDEFEPSNARRSGNQLDMFGAADGDAAAAETAVPAPPPQTRDEEPDNGLINLFVRARQGQPFSGPDVVRVLNSIGMRHGEMSIFHHYGAGELLCQEPVFSAANMFEPGTFDLNRIEAFQTSGIVLFMQLPTPLDGPVAFELLLNTAQRLGELIGGELFATPKTRLDSKNIARLRQRAARFTDART